MEPNNYDICGGLGFFLPRLQETSTSSPLRFGGSVCIVFCGVGWASCEINLQITALLFLFEKLYVEENVRSWIRHVAQLIGWLETKRFAVITVVDAVNKNHHVCLFVMVLYNARRVSVYQRHEHVRFWLFSYTGPSKPVRKQKRNEVLFTTWSADTEI